MTQPNTFQCMIDFVQYLQEQETPFSIVSACEDTGIGKAAMRTWLHAAESRGWVENGNFGQYLMWRSRIYQEVQLNGVHRL